MELSACQGQRDLYFLPLRLSGCPQSEMTVSMSMDFMRSVVMGIVMTMTRLLFALLILNTFGHTEWWGGV